MAALLVEACVLTVAQAVGAEQAGADRIELCGPGDGGTTPSLALVEACVRAVGVPVHVMIRPHGEGFELDSVWHPVMQRDMALSIAAGARGVVVGALRDGAIDVACVRACVEAAGDAPVVFHRAFDQLSELSAALPLLRSLGVGAVLTAGGAATAVQGAEQLDALQRQGGDAFTVMAGGGIRAHNVLALLDRAPQLRAVHVRATDTAVFRDTVASIRAWSARHASHEGAE